MKYQSEITPEAVRAVKEAIKHRKNGRRTLTLTDDMRSRVMAAYTEGRQYSLSYVCKTAPRLVPGVHAAAAIASLYESRRLNTRGQASISHAIEQGARKTYESEPKIGIARLQHRLHQDLITLQAAILAAGGTLFVNKTKTPRATMVRAAQRVVKKHEEPEKPPAHPDTITPAKALMAALLGLQQQLPALVKPPHLTVTYSSAMQKSAAHEHYQAPFARGTLVLITSTIMPTDEISYVIRRNIENIGWRVDQISASIEGTSEGWGDSMEEVVEQTTTLQLIRG